MLTGKGYTIYCDIQTLFSFCQTSQLEICPPGMFFNTLTAVVFSGNELQQNLHFMKAPDNRAASSSVDSELPMVKCGVTV